MARLDALFTLSVNDKSKLFQHRVASLNHAFQRDLHLRVFNAVASLGFDDVDWLPTSDLNFLKTIGEGEIAKLKTELSEEEAAKARQTFGSNRFDETKLRKAQQKIQELEIAMAPYIQKLRERTVT